MKYKDFIDNIINTRGQWGIPESEYFERHHIKPRCLGFGPFTRNGRKTKHENIIWLYPEEHYRAHKLLALENPDNVNLVKAWWYIHVDTKHDNCEITEEEYGLLRRKISELISKSTKGVKKPPRDALYCKHISEAKMGEKNGMYGVNAPNSKKIRCVETGKIYQGSQEAAADVGAYATNIRKCCRGELNRTCKLHWEWVED